MVAIGSVLVLIGFAVILPRDGLPGSASRTVLRQGMHLWRTSGARSGHDEPDRSWPYSVLRVAIGLGILAAGVWLATRGIDNGPEPGH